MAEAADEQVGDPHAQAGGGDGDGEFCVFVVITLVLAIGDVFP